MSQIIQFTKYENWNILNDYCLKVNILGPHSRNLGQHLILARKVTLHEKRAPKI